LCAESRRGLHQQYADLFRKRGVKLERTYQLNTGGNTDFLDRTHHPIRHRGRADDFYVVTGYHHKRVEAFLGRLSRRLDVPVRTIFNARWQDTDNGISVLSAA